MAGNLQPLDRGIQLVKPDGTATDFFIRWAQERQIDIRAGITEEQLIAYLTDHLLQAGNGISLTPDGNIVSRPTIAAKVQEILDQISAVRGTILYRGNAAWAALAPGTAGFFLQTAGAGADPVWAAAGGGGGGALVLLEQHTAAGSATLDFPGSITATYDEYQIEFIGLVPATNNVSLLMRMSTDGGATYDAGANYSWTAAGTNRFGQASGGADSGATSIPCNYGTINNTATIAYNGHCRLFDPESAARHKAINGIAFQSPDGATLQNDQFGGFYRSLTAVNAFQFLFSAGNIASGIIRVYGIAK